MGGDSYVKVKVIYCSRYFDEIIGITEDNAYIAAFPLMVDRIKEVYPIDLSTLYIHKDVTISISTLDPNIIPYMHYGSIAYYIMDLYTTLDNITVKCNHAVKMILDDITDTHINYLYHCDNYTSMSNNNMIIINEDTFTINNTIYDTTTQEFWLNIIGLDRIKKAIERVQQTNIVITEINSLHDICEIINYGHTQYFFELLKLCL